MLVVGLWLFVFVWGGCFRFDCDWLLAVALFCCMMVFLCGLGLRCLGFLVLSVLAGVLVGVLLGDCFLRGFG